MVYWIITLAVICSFLLFCVIMQGYRISSLGRQLFHRNSQVANLNKYIGILHAGIIKNQKEAENILSTAEKQREDIKLLNNLSEKLRIASFTLIIQLAMTRTFIVKQK